MQTVVEKLVVKGLRNEGSTFEGFEMLIVRVVNLNLRIIDWLVIFIKLFWQNTVK